MAKVFENILNNARAKGIEKQNTRESIEWFRINIRKTAVSEVRLMREEKDNLVQSWTNAGIGKLYMAHYDPKHKKTLPYYDTFPLVIPFHKYNDGFLGLNLHYLPPVLRAKLLDSLYETLNNDRFDEKTKLMINYSKLKALSEHKLMQPCIKRYLGAHFRSRFLKVPQESWTAAVFLPTERFVKSTKANVWAESRKRTK